MTLYTYTSCQMSLLSVNFSLDQILKVKVTTAPLHAPTNDPTKYQLPVPQIFEM